MKQELVNTIINRLSNKFNTVIELNYSTPWELLVAVVLSAQCTDKLVNIVTQTLFKKYTTVADYANTPLHEFQHDIRQIGFYLVKAAHIQKTAQIVLNKYNGVIPQTMEELLTLPGIGRKSANVLLSGIYHKNMGVIVDTHVRRLSQRLHLVSPEKIGGTDKLFITINNKRVVDFVRNANVEKIEAELMEIVPQNQWDVFSHLIVKLGRYVCKAISPLCNECLLKDLCPVRRSNLSA